MDFYKILEVEPNATVDEIKRAYRRQALLWHPDRNKSPGAKERFQNIQLAYETLINTNTRTNYDRIKVDSPLGVIYFEFLKILYHNFEVWNILPEDRAEFVAMFNPDDYQEELKTNNYKGLQDKICDKIADLFPQFMWKKLKQIGSKVRESYGKN